MWDDAPIAWWQAMHWMNKTQSAVNRWLTWPVAIVLMLILSVCYLPISNAYHAYLPYKNNGRDDSGRTQLLFITGIVFRVLVVICLLPSLFRALKAILREKNGDTWDSLLLTPIGRKQIVYEKWWGVLLSERPAYYVLCVILLAQTFTGLVSYTGAIEVLVGIPAMMAFWGAMGLYLSSRMKTIFQATTTAVVILVVYIIAASIILGSITSGFGGDEKQYFIGFF